MAVQTEDHPVKYLDFEGTIPKGEYGGGDMWIFARGRYEITKEKKDGFYFRFQSREWNDEYRMIHTKGKDWLCERLVPPQIDWLRDPIEPMLAQGRDKPFDSPEFLYEIKWDGIRAMVALDEGKITIRSRAQRDITNLFPELQIPEAAFRAACGLFDVEIVCLNAQGQPVFENVLHRLQHRNEVAINRTALRTRQYATYSTVCMLMDARSSTNRSLVVGLG